MFIYFNTKNMRNYLFNHKMVYTLRDNRMAEGETQIRIPSDKESPSFEIIGYANVTFVKEILNPYDLKDYVLHSGFRTIDDWLEKAGESRFLHKVELK